MPKKIISFNLKEENIEKVDKTAKALGMSRSELIEFMLEKGFTFPKEVETTLNNISKMQEEAKEKIEKRGKTT
ncbi:MAG: ribbon-helix-helix domain-containing protein [Thermoproteota archaeon]|nr:ribbon-helix-helix domain-containing protein [Thermoproteota archaeon]